MYKYGNHLTPGLAEVSASGAVFTSFLVHFFRVLGFRIPFLNAW